MHTLQKIREFDSAMVYVQIVQRIYILNISKSSHKSE